MYRPLNINPAGRRTDDCVIRALAKAFNVDWVTMYDYIAAEGRRKFDIMQANHVWIGWLERHGFKMFPIPNTCPDCYTVRDFCREHRAGTYILGTGTHVIAAEDGDWYDTFDSGDLIPVYYFRRRNGI